MQGDVQLPSGSQEASVNVTVTFVNLGDASLRILGATTSCACALAKNVEEQSLLPGEKRADSGIVGILRSKKLV